MPKQVPPLSNAPRPLAPYSVATEANGFVFISGQVALDRSGGPTPDRRRRPDQADHGQHRFDTRRTSAWGMPTSSRPRCFSPTSATSAG